MPDLKRGRGLPAILKAREERAAGRSRWTMRAGVIIRREEEMEKKNLKGR